MFSFGNVAKWQPKEERFKLFNEQRFVFRILLNKEREREGEGGREKKKFTNYFKIISRKCSISFFSSLFNKIYLSHLCQCENSDSGY